MVIALPQDRRPHLEPLEDRTLPSSAALSALLDAVNRYNLSDNAADLDRPVVPLYTDFQAGGTYGEINDAVRVTLDGNDPDAGRGPSGFRMTWDGSGANGYFQFGLGTTVANRPREAADFGFAGAVRFLARGDFVGRQVQANVYRTLAGNGIQQVASAWITLGTSWADYALALPAGLRPQDLHAVQFVLDPAHGGGGTIVLDEVRISTDGFDPLRLVQSFSGSPRAATGSSPSTLAGRDLLIYPSHSFLYDNALVIKALAAAQDSAALQAARDIADAILATAGNGTAGYLNQRASGHVLLGNGAPRAPQSGLQTLGDNSWFALALLDLYHVTGAEIYLTRAREISDWAEANLKVGGLLKGYRGGYDAAGSAFTWRSTEHNCDLFQVNHRLAGYLAARNDSSAAIYAARATDAGDFVLAMYDATEGKFWTGTTTGDLVNTASVPVDTQLWTLASVGRAAQYAGAIDWSRQLLWAETHLLTSDGSFAGFTYSDQSTPNRVWFEGVASGAVVYQLTGATDRRQQALATLQQALTAYGVLATSSNSLEDPSLGAVYDARAAVAPTAWFYLASRGLNPFDLDLQPATAEAFQTAPSGEEFVDFGAGGFWRWSATGWTRLSTANVSEFTLASNGDVYADFDALGFWRWRVGSWTLLSGASAETFQVAGNGDVYVDFGSSGFWRWSASGWANLSGSNAVSHRVAGNGDAYVDFGSSGFWRWSASSGWAQLSAARPAEFQFAPNGDVYADFAAIGFWRWSASGWTRLSTGNAEAFRIAATGEVYADFAAIGLWRWNGTGWALLSTANAEGFEIAATGALYADFGGLGFWTWSPAGWSLLSSADVTTFQTGPNSAVYADFDGLGFWTWSTGGWAQLSTANAEAFQIAGNGEVYVDFGALGFWRRSNAGWAHLSTANAPNVSRL